MSENQRLDNIEVLLKSHGDKLDRIGTALGQIAVQNEQITNLQCQIRALNDKYNRLTDPNDGSITVIKQHQASCPRKQMKFLWAGTTAQIVLVIGFLWKLLTMPHP